MHIKSWYAAMDRTHITRYQEIHGFKTAMKGVIQDYSENIKASFSGLQNNSFVVIESTIHRSSNIITSSNNTKVSEISSFIYT